MNEGLYDQYEQTSQQWMMVWSKLKLNREDIWIKPNNVNRRQILHLEKKVSHQ